MEKATARKQPHALFRATDPTEFEAALSASGTELDELLAEFLPAGSRAGVLLGGSLAERVGNATSDVDLLVLIEDDVVLTLPEGLSLRPGRALEIVSYRNGIEFNVEVFRRRDVLALVESLVMLAPALYDPRDLVAIPMLQPYDLRFLHRLRNGWVLRGPEQVDLWRDELMVEVLSTYLCLRHLNTFNELYEDAVAIGRAQPAGGFLVARTCIENSLRALLAYRGFTSQARKWIPSWVDQLPPGPDRDLGERALALLLAGFDDCDPDAHLVAVLRLNRDVAALLVQSPEIHAAMKHLGSELTYVKG